MSRVTVLLLSMQHPVEAGEHAAAVTEHEQRRAVQTGAVPQIRHWQGTPCSRMHTHRYFMQCMRYEARPSVCPILVLCLAWRALPITAVTWFASEEQERSEEYSPLCRLHWSEEYSPCRLHVYLPRTSWCSAYRPKMQYGSLRDILHLAS